MDRVEKLTNSALGPSTNFLFYTRVRAKAPRVPIFIFEGVDDPKYYTPRISYRFQQHWRPLSVKGKNNVLELKDDLSINPAYQADPVCFFVDRDFDDNVVGTFDLYVTPHYSVENFYVGGETVRQLIVSLCGLSTANLEDEDILDLVSDLYDRFRLSYTSNKEIRRIYFSYFFVRKALEDKRLSLDALFEIKHEMGEEYRCTVTLKEKGAFALANRDLPGIRRFIRGSAIARRILKGDVNYFRGKQELNFIRDFLNAIRSDGQAINKYVLRKTGRRLRFKNTSIGNDILSDLSAAASTPKCLTDFLDKAHKRFGL